MAGFPGVKEAHVLGFTQSIHAKENAFILGCFCITSEEQSFAELKTVEGDLCSSFREACFRLGLLEDDNQYHLVMQEASVSNSASSLHSLFAT